MKVYGLSGKAGSGKSYNAIELCGKLGAEAVVDDGLLIVNGKIVAGVSAKKQPTKVGAIKAAIFTDEKQRAELAAEIKRQNVQGLLILGTSDEMVCMIADKLEVPAPAQIVHIEDITTPEQRQLARRSRDKLGMHVIPAPTMQVQKNFSGYFLNAKSNFYQGFAKANQAEKTVIRPSYSFLGEFKISSRVFTDIVAYHASFIPEITNLIWVVEDTSEEGCYVRIIADFAYGSSARSAALKLQKRVHEDIGRMTAFNVLGVEVEIHDFSE